MNMHDDLGTNNDFLSFTDSVFVRPKMYTINGTLEEVGAFLEGFYSGMAAHNRHKMAQQEAMYWFDFCSWASKQYNVDETCNWRTLFTTLRQNYRRDEDGFVKLASLYVEFLRYHREQ